MKTTYKRKDPIQLRAKKLANGDESLYLDWRENGKRKYEFLKMYIVKATDEASKARNDNTMRAAKAIQLQRINDLANRKAGQVDNTLLAKASLQDWLQGYLVYKQEHSYKDVKHLKTFVNILEKYDNKATLEDVNKDFVLGLTRWLKITYKQSNGKPLGQTTIHNYLNYFSISLSLAVRKGIIKSNPFKELDKSEKVKVKPSQRVFLTIDEVKRLAETDCTNETVKCAFMLACFCGLRISDVRALRWKDIQRSGEQTFIYVTMKKTSEPIGIPLADKALRWLSKEQKPTDKVFNLPNEHIVARIIKDWAKAANIDKLVTFHVARHTFATLALSQGADIYTISKLLGHSSVAITQIYAKITDKSKTDAIALLNNVL